MIILAILLTILLLAVCYFDMTKFIIPNSINIIIIALYPIYVLTSPEPVNWQMALVVMIAAFIFGLGIFALNIMGGGDVKLIVALCLWIGWQPYVLIQFFTWVALAGGVLALFKILVKYTATQVKKHRHLPHFIKEEGNIPYGLAIAYSFGYLLWKGVILPLNT